MKKVVLLFIIPLFLGACLSKELQNAGAVAAGIWGTEKASVSKGTLMDSEKGKVKVITLTLENLKNIPKDYPMENVTSMSAFSFIDNLPAEEYKDYASVKIVVKTNSQTFEEAFEINKILIAIEGAKDVDLLAKKIVSGNLEGFETVFDRKVFTDSVIDRVKDIVLSNERINGKPEKEFLIRYEFRANSETKEDHILYYVNISNKKVSDTYYMMVNAVTKKIISFGTNPKKEN